jgi:serine/threonine protein kinase
MADWPVALAPGLAGHLSRYIPVKPIRNTGPEHIVLAQETDPGRQVVIKLLQYDASADSEVWSRRSQLLVRSGVTLGRLRHPNIVELYDFGVSPDGVLLVMEYLEGGSLDQKLATFGMLEAVDLIPIARDLASGLDYIHEGGLVHCDIRPGRIAMDAEGKCRLLGFSSARSPGATSVGGGVSLPASVIYAAPEQLAGNIVPATDQFSLAAVIYRALTGRRPFRATELVTLIGQILADTPAAPSRVRPGLPQGVDTVMARALAKNPGDRFRDCSQFADAFEDAFGRGSGQWLSRVDPEQVGKWVKRIWGR